MSKTEQLSRTLAANLAFFMQRDGSIYTNANTLGKASDISPNTIRYYLDPSKRPQTSSSKTSGFPTMDKLQVIAEKLGCEVWELLHPDIQRSIREREMYKNIEANYNKLQKNCAKDKEKIHD